ncbi:4-coumarate-CoA ligase [Coemansia spiralis]|nr:4-coumarate-CoA ligase [Coemansia spiralis]
MFSSPYPDITTPKLDIPSFVFATAAKDSVFGNNPNLVALTEATVILSYGGIKRLTEEFASGLANKLGLKKGDVIAMLLPNTPYYPVFVLGAHMIGITCAVANPAYTYAEIKHLLTLTEAKAILTTIDIVPTVLQALQNCKAAIPREFILTIDGAADNVTTTMCRDLYKRILITNFKEAQTTPAFIVLNSGTTGLPKGVIISHANITSNTLQYLTFLKHDMLMSHFDKTNSYQAHNTCLPYFHIYGHVVILLASICRGHHQIILRKFDLKKHCQLVVKHKAAYAYLVPPILLMLAKSLIVDKYKLSSITHINRGAAPLSKETQEQAQARIGCHILQMYGLSETLSLVSRCPMISSLPTGSIRHLLPSMQCKIIDDSSRRLGANRIGEICLRGPSVMMATREAFDGDGFFYTGEIGYVDANGFYFILDQKKELIKFKGFSIAPAGLERILVAHPAVLDAAVIPVYQKKQGTEVPKAYVVLRPSAKNSPRITEEIKLWVAERVASYKALRGGIEIVDAIPKSVSGKILRRLLKDCQKQTPKL